MKTLVVYYSRSGQTQKIAKAIASACGAQLETLQDVKTRKNLWGYLRSGYESLFSRQAQIQVVRQDPNDYDLVILGSPLWAGRLCSPMRTYLIQQKAKFNNVAFFCTEGGSGAAAMFNNMAELCAHPPLATLEITAAELKSGASADKISDFIHALSLPMQAILSAKSETGKTH